MGSLHDTIATQQPNICQIVAYRDGTEIYADEWNGYRREDACHVMSVTKSIVSLLIGIAIDKGAIESIEQPVLSFFPDYQIKRGEKTIQSVTIRHLLTMTAPYKYKSEPWTKVCTSDDWTIAALDLLGGRAGLTGEFRYSTLGIHILTGILAKTTGMKTVDFANEYLFSPIGVAAHKNYIAPTEQEHKQFTISKEPRENVWFVDPQGIGTAGYGLCFSASDMAKLGQLSLDGGVCGGRQIVSANWIKEMSAPRLSCDGTFRNMTYGYLWWIIDRDKGVYAAIGNSGNVIYIDPVTRTVIAITAYFKPTVFDRIDFIEQQLIPVISSKQ